jgi:hypothetical protein
MNLKLTQTKKLALLKSIFTFVSSDPDGPNTLGSENNDRKSLLHSKKYG